MSTPERGAWRVRIAGLVQGVGFRPFVHRLANSLALSGWVCNDGAGVLIHAEGDLAALDAFRQRLESQAPRAARIERIAHESAVVEMCAGFIVRHDPSPSAMVQARVSADRAICSTCRAEVLDPANRRFRHPFATCTDCGPRFSILKEIPYERHHTSMRDFGMCEACRAEYESPADRRFHAEPIACPDCGPRLRFRDPARAIVLNGWPAMDAAAERLRNGAIVAIKGLGGYPALGARRR